MASRGRGWVINIGSEAARMYGAVAAYGASKVALEHVTRSMAAEAGASGVTVNALVPSAPIATPGLTWAIGDAPAAQEPARFAEAAVRLALVDPSRTNGRVLYSDDLLEPDRAPRGWHGSPATRPRLFAETYVDTINRGAYGSLRHLFAPAAVFLGPGNRTVLGDEAIGAFYESFLPGLAPQIRISSYVEAGDDCVFELEAVLRDTSEPTLGGIDHATIGPDGRVVRMAVFTK
jgi:hypothetical protein